MYLLTFGDEIKATVHKGTQDITPDGELIFIGNERKIWVDSPQSFENYNLSTKELCDIYNSLPGKPVKKFENLTAAKDRLFKRIVECAVDFVPSAPADEPAVFVPPEPDFVPIAASEDTADICEAPVAKITEARERRAAAAQAIKDAKAAKTALRQNEKTKRSLKLGQAYPILAKSKKGSILRDGVTGKYTFAELAKRANMTTYNAMMCVRHAFRIYHGISYSVDKSCRITLILPEGHTLDSMQRAKKHH